MCGGRMNRSIKRRGRMGCSSQNVPRQVAIKVIVLGVKLLAALELGKHGLSARAEIVDQLGIGRCRNQAAGPIREQPREDKHNRDQRGEKPGGRSCIDSGRMRVHGGNITPGREETRLTFHRQMGVAAFARNQSDQVTKYATSPASAARRLAPR